MRVCSVLLSYESADQTQIVWISSKCFYPSSISPGLFIFNCDNIEILVKVAADGAWDLTHAELYVCHCAQLLAEPWELCVPSKKLMMPVCCVASP